MGISKRDFYGLLLRGGAIVGRVTGPYGKTRAECGGIEIPCEWTFKYGQKKVLDKLKTITRELLAIPSTMHTRVLFYYTRKKDSDEY